jgi:hypothetical protein
MPLEQKKPCKHEESLWLRNYRTAALAEIASSQNNAQKPAENIPTSRSVPIGTEEVKAA